MAKSVNPKIIVDKDVDKNKVLLSLRRDNSTAFHWRPLVYHVEKGLVNNGESHSPGIFRYPSGDNNWSDKIDVIELEGCEVELIYTDDSTFLITKETKKIDVGLPVKTIHIKKP